MDGKKNADEQAESAYVWMLDQAVGCFFRYIRYYYGNPALAFTSAICWSWRILCSGM
jgi:hypothetical protein